MPARLPLFPEIRKTLDTLAEILPSAEVTYAEDGTRAVLMHEDAIFELTYDMATFNVRVRATTTKSEDWRELSIDALRRGEFLFSGIGA